VKLLYGVQGTGQGHISRARAMAAALRHYDVEVTWLFSGRPREQLRDMQPFGDFLYRRGLTFVTRAGRLRYLPTLLNNHLPQFLRDVRTLDLGAYDAVVTDFEPVTAWAARRAGIPAIGIGHQYAFTGETPTVAGHWLARLVMQQFAPVSQAIGLHWHPWAGNILPPILDLPARPAVKRNSAAPVIVYLPFEDQAAVTCLLQQFPAQRFHQYAPALTEAQCDNVARRATSATRFKRDLAGCAGVICNSGFELISECLQWGIPVLTRPLAGQMEQQSNALALQELGYARVVPTLEPSHLQDWLERRQPPPALHFPDVAGRLARWLAEGAHTPAGNLARQLWQDSRVSAGPPPEARTPEARTPEARTPEAPTPDGRTPTARQLGQAAGSVSLTPLFGGGQAWVDNQFRE
tara:strand:- start:188 stop:1408 length:1221 start_codon:yes stop_codon:yes gene_type:complete